MRIFFWMILLLASSASADFRALYKEGKFADALSELEKSPEAAGRGYAYYLNRGLIHHALNQEPLAYANLVKAKALHPEGAEVDEPLAEATAAVVKWLGIARIDATSYPFETWGDALPLDSFFLGFTALSLLSWLGFFVFRKKRAAFTRGGFVTFLLAALFGGWSTWNEQHPLVIVTESRLVKSGPGETFLDRGPIEPGMKLRIVGEMDETRSGASAGRWWKVRFNDRHDLGFLPERSGLLLTDESNTPEP